MPDTPPAIGHLLLADQRLRQIARQFRREFANHSSAARGIRIVIGPVIMDAGPNMSIAIPRQWRRADRRAGLDQLLRHVAADLIDATDRRHLSNILTERLRQLARMRSVGLKEITSTMHPRSVQPVRARDYVAFSVPVREEGRQVMLEASFDARNGPDDWTCQLIEAAASLAAVLLETERLACTPAPLTRPSVMAQRH